MNIISGMSIKGLSLSTIENFNSIPGLFLQMDGKERKEIRPRTSDGNLYLRSWTSKKEPFYQFSANTSYNVSNRLNHFSTDKGVISRYYQFDPPDGVKSGDVMRKMGVESDIAFVKNGAFGIYTISRHWKAVGTGGDTNATSIIEFGSFAAGQSAFVVNNLCNGVQGGIRLTYSNNGVATNSITTVLANNDSPMNEINSMGFVYKGNGVPNNYSLKINNSQKLTASHDINLQYPVTSMSLGRLQNLRDATVEVMLVLVYNFNGVSPAVIDQYDARIRVLLEQYKLTL